MKSQQQLAPVRNTDPETSREAAESVDAKLTAHQRAVLGVFTYVLAVSDEDLIKWYGSYRAVHPATPRQSDSGIRTRRAELVAKGKVEHFGYGVNARGRRVRLWRAV